MLGKSWTNNLSRTYFHDAVDYRVTKPSGSGCQSCGQVPGSADDDACLRLTRYHRYHDIGYPSSFGPGVFLAYDASLQLSANAAGVVTNVEWFTPQESRAYDFVTGSSTGSYVNAAEGVVKSLELFDSNNALTADITAAARAVITRWDGAHDDFAIIALGSELARSGRLTATVDRAGNTTAIAYSFAPTASDAALNWDRTKLWQVASITDCHGQSAAPTYAWHDGQWVVTQIRCPDGKDVTYSYGSNFLVGLEGVTYANGDQANFNTWYDTGTQAQVVEMFDPAAGGSHRRKSLYLTPTVTDIDAAGFPTTFSRDALGREVAVMDAYAYDDAGQLLTLTDTDGKIVRRGYNTRGLLSSVELSLDGATFTSVASREYDAAGRLGSSTYGNVKVETRGYLAGEPMVETIVTPGPSASSAVANLTYTYDNNRRKTSEFDAVTPLSNQGFGYDDAGRLTSWNRPVSSASQSWDLSAVGDWRSTTRDGVTETRTHTAVHEVTGRAVGAITHPLSYDGKGNLTDDGYGRSYRWDGENRLQRALVQGYASTSFLGAGATYVYDALGRRVAKTVNGRTTRYVLAGAQVLLERDGIPEALASQRAGGAQADGDLAALNDTPVYGGILRAATAGAVKRINFQPDGVQIPIGFIKDAGRSQGVRTNGLTYGWSAAVEDRAQDREGAAELAELDTCVRLQPAPASAAASWAVAIPNGTYPVAIVCGDPSSLDQTNDLVVNGQHLVDPDPRGGSFGYRKGDFDGFLVQATVADGYLRIATDTEAFDPKICFIEVGPEGAVIDQATRDRMDQFIQRSSDATSDPANRFAGRRIFAYGSYVDEVLAYSADVGGLVSTYYVHNNHLYSPTAITNAAGMVQERYRYDAYGKQAILSADGMERGQSNVGFDRGFTGYVADSETGLCYARARMYSAELGRFVSRDPLGYVDGFGEYAAYFAVNSVDPMGLKTWWPFEEYVERYIKEHPNLTPEQIEWVRRVAARGCVGMTTIHLGSAPRLGRCFNSRESALKLKEAFKCREEDCKPRIFSIHFFDKGKDANKEMPSFWTVKYDEWTGHADMRDWNFEKDGTVNFDFGFELDDGTLVSGTTYFNPDRDGNGVGDIYPELPIKEAAPVAVNTLEEWKGMLGGHFNSEVWCVQCESKKYGAK